ncbi:hypothetical protein [Blastococcus sp. LR1]|uniref:hypothetical protein n=1 Tax=Blastococcus sp. LR1 TaxID=2877000 RepID=UPI001CCF3A22|nr:hypothetical protein [Blastococcus sp. LR1]MCA0144438.1 hypothetical protein [Blastococcus sp. LR1]
MPRRRPRPTPACRCRSHRTASTRSPGFGTVTLTRQGNGIALGEARPEEGWSVDTSGDEDEADVEFRRGREDVDVETDLEDDGRLGIEVCDDDD